MINNNYFTPSIEDIRVGYECEIQSSYGWQKGKWPEILYEDTVNGFITDKKGLIEGSKFLRVPYLTKEQIEAEGWIYQADHTNVSRFKKEQYFLDYNFTDKWILITETAFETKKYFNGECKDINTFRYICKLLGI